MLMTIYEERSFEQVVGVIEIGTKDEDFSKKIFGNKLNKELKKIKAKFFQKNEEIGYLSFGRNFIAKTIVDTTGGRTRTQEKIVS